MLPVWPDCYQGKAQSIINQVLGLEKKNWFRCFNSMKSSRAKMSHPLCLVGKKTTQNQETARGNPTIPPDKARRTGAASPLCSEAVRVEKERKSKTEKAFLKSYRGWGRTQISNHVMATNWCRGISARAEKLREAGAKLITACLTLIWAESADGGRMLRRKSDLYVLTRSFDICSCCCHV